MKLIAREWVGFRERVVPANAGEVQVQEMRRAFYAGSEAMLRAITTNLDPGTEATDADMARMDGIEAELREFADDVARGRA